MTLELDKEEVSLLKLLVANYTRRVSGRITFKKQWDMDRGKHGVNWTSSPKIKPEDYRHKEVLVNLKEKLSATDK